MIVQHNVTGQISRAVRMPASFRVGDRVHPAGTLVVFESDTRRRFVPPDAIDTWYTEVEISLAPPYLVVEEEARG